MRGTIALVSFASIAVCSTNVRADAEVTADAARPAAPDSAYVEVGMLWGTEHWVGGDTWSEGGLAVAAGYRIWRLPIWARATAVLGDATTSAMTTVSEHSLFELRGGLEGRGCVVRYVCASAGVDLALHVESWTESANMGWGTNTDFQKEAVVIPRVGLAVGNKVQFRPSLELAYGLTDNTYALDLTATAAYRW